MSKKLPIISTVIGISISALGSLVPISANAKTLYLHVPEIAEMNTLFSEAMEECGSYNESPEFQTCFNSKKNYFLNNQNRGIVKAMFAINTNDKMMVSAYNPSAGTARFYVDETAGYEKEAFTFENLVVFWADLNATPSPYWNDEAAWAFADSVFAGDPIPNGYHVMYKGKRGEDGWMTANAENRVVFEDNGDFIRDNGPRYFFILGYDTAGNRHMNRSAYNGCIGYDYTEGGECLLQYEYSEEYDVAAYSYTKAETAPEDETLAEIRKAIRAANEAERRAALAEARAAAIEEAYFDTLEQLWAMENTIIDYETTISDIENRLSGTENQLMDTENLLSDTANQLENTSSKLIEAETELASAKTALSELEELFKKTQETSEKYQKALEEALESAKEATRLAEEARKVADEAISRAESLTNTPNTITIYRTVESAVAQNTTNNSTAEIDEQILKTAKTEPEDVIELPTSGNEEKHDFPWWIIVFVFTGISLILWWFIPLKRKSEEN